ncbi:MAG: hypothetical protein NTW62_02780 [Candidatus Nomurabacteria bacterium]|nr:hypothetical protein [Candidatus Nomurabacteria bacterium]
MNQSDNDPFAYRSQGGAFNIGLEEGDNVSALIKVDENLFCVTRKNTRCMVMADDVDPERTNPNINHNIQHILPYGSDSELVGKTLQQANILFADHSLAQTINHNKGISTAFSFLKEITSLDKTKNDYVLEENGIKTNLSKNPQIPSLPNLEQKVKGFVLNADHACAHIMEMANLFYPDVKGKGWESKLIGKLDATSQDDFINFIKSFEAYTVGIRRMRNKIEHPHGELKDDLLNIENYKLTPENTISPPSIIYKSDVYNLPKIKISAFMESTITNLVNIFELLMAYLCNLHAEPFAGDKRVVVSVPEDKREESAKHVGFEYQILWTK